MLKPAIFLDRDNTLNIDEGYSPQMELFPDVIPFLEELFNLGIPTIVISNQSSIGRGFTTFESVLGFNKLLWTTVLPEGKYKFRPRATYFCPHLPADKCCCRKPQPGLLYKAAIEYHIDLGRSVMIGDKVSDFAAAKRATCLPVRIIRSINTTKRTPYSILGGYIIKSLDESIPLIKKWTSRQTTNLLSEDIILEQMK